MQRCLSFQRLVGVQSSFSVILYCATWDADPLCIHWVKTFALRGVALCIHWVKTFALRGVALCIHWVKTFALRGVALW